MSVGPSVEAAQSSAAAYEGALKMSRSGKPTPNSRKSGTQAGHAAVGKSRDCSTGPEDGFPAAFAAARGTVSPELDLCDPVSALAEGHPDRQSPADE